MAFYLVRAKPKKEKLPRLKKRLEGNSIDRVKPFGTALSTGLRNARVDKDEMAVWEEEDYCHPPLAQERQFLLDEYFDDIWVEPVQKDSGWQRIRSLPFLFPGLHQSESRN